MNCPFTITSSKVYYLSCMRFSTHLLESCAEYYVLLFVIIARVNYISGIRSVFL
jgi:hypothetical protein